MEDNINRGYLYANSVSINTNVFDIQLDFETKVEDRTTDRIKIVMSPQHLKLFANLLARSVSDYEEKVGKINLPDEKISTSDKAEK